jgi:hypothetical protein
MPRRDTAGAQRLRPVYEQASHCEQQCTKRVDVRPVGVVDDSDDRTTSG